MWYIITGVFCCFLIILNNRKRKANPIKYLILTLILPPIGYGLWQAEKPLIENEERHGGKGWNVMKWVALIHTVLCIFWGFYGVILGATMTSEATSDAAKAGAAIGTGLGIMLIMMVWFGGVVGSLILGAILKKPIIEKAEPQLNT